MEYVIADRNSTGMDAYWFKRGLHTLGQARREAVKYPEAKYIIEYLEDAASKGVLPTGRAWPLKDGDAGYAAES